MSFAGFARIVPGPSGGGFLGVERSFSGRRWRDGLDVRGHAAALEMVQRGGIGDALARVLAARGVAPAEVEAFLEPRVRELMPDPSTLADMDVAADRLASAVVDRERVAVFGDYDVDGACSAALIGAFLAAYDVPHEIYIPDRIVEGYGPNAGAITTLHASGATLLVTVDCGTTSFAALGVAADLGLDTVVLDHHLADAELPRARAVVNPNRQDDLSGQGHLAACGVVLLTLVAVQRALKARGLAPRVDILGLLDLVALGTVADVVPLKGLNRAFVRRGLEVMARRERAGLTALMDVARLDGPPQPWHLGFLLGPRINAGGRIGRADLGARLLLAADATAAAPLAGQLDRLNTERQEIERTIIEDAFGKAEHQIAAGNPAVLVVSGEDWHPGVVGLVASRLKERYARPVFAFAPGAEGQMVGSGRSVLGVDLGRAVRHAVERKVIEKGGGHPMAAGATVRTEMLPVLREALEAELAADVAAALGERDLMIDGMIAAAAATPELAAEISRAGPFGSGCREPVFALASHVLSSVEVVGQGHLRIRLRSGDGATLGAVAFRAAEEPLGRALLERRGTGVHVAGTLAVDSWGGRQRVELRLRDAGLSA